MYNGKNQEPKQLKKDKKMEEEIRIYVDDREGCGRSFAKRTEDDDDMDGIDCPDIRTCENPNSGFTEIHTGIWQCNSCGNCVEAETEPAACLIPSLLPCTDPENPNWRRIYPPIE